MAFSMDDATRARICSLLRARKSQRFVARSVGCSLGTVNKIAQELRAAAEQTPAALALKGRVAEAAETDPLHEFTDDEVKAAASLFLRKSMSVGQSRLDAAAESAGTPVRDVILIREHYRATAETLRKSLSGQGSGEVRDIDKLAAGFEITVTPADSEVEGEAEAVDEGVA